MAVMQNQIQQETENRTDTGMIHGFRFAGLINAHYDRLVA